MTTTIGADRIFVSSCAMPAPTVAGIVREAARRGIKGIELGSGVGWYPGLREEIRSAAREGTRMLLHNYSPAPEIPFVVNLASVAPGIRRRTVEHCRNSIWLSAEIGAPFYSVHAGFAQDLNPFELGTRINVRAPQSLQDAELRFFEAVAELAETADEAGIDLLVENNVLSTGNLVSGTNQLLLGVSAQDFRRLFEAVPKPRLGLLLDVGHLKVSAETLGLSPDLEFEQVRDFIGAVHLSDNDGKIDDNRPFDGGAWFIRHLPGLPHARVVIEVNPVPSSVLLECIRLVENVL